MENFILLIDIGTSFLKGLSFLPTKTGPKISDFFKVRSNPKDLRDFKEKLDLLVSSLSPQPKIWGGGLNKKSQQKNIKTMFSSGEGVGFGDIVRIKFEREDPSHPITKRELSLMIKTAQEKSARNVEVKAKSKNLILVFADIEKAELDNWEMAWPLGVGGSIAFVEIVNFYLPLSLYWAIKKVLSHRKIKDFSFYYFPRALTHLFAGEKNTISRTFLDVGGENTQIFRIKSDRLESVSEIPYGGDHFTKKIIETIGLEGEKHFQEEFVEEIKKKVHQGILAPYLKKRIAKILALGYQEWEEKVLERLKEDPGGSEIYLLGGGSALPIFSKVKNSLEKVIPFPIIQIAARKGTSFKIEGKSDFNIGDPQFINPLLIAKVISQGKVLSSSPPYYDLFPDLLY